MATREGFPSFEVSVGVDFGNPFLASMVLALRCTRCGQTHFVFEESWREGADISGSTETRGCPYCYKASRLPAREGGDDVEPKREVMEELAEDERGFVEEPEDDEHVQVPEEDEDVEARSEE